MTAASLLALFALSTLAANTPVSPLWGTLMTGPHSVGFDIYYRYDLTRSWKPKYDAAGHLTEGSRGRPIRMSVCYPAAKSTATRMVYRNYVFLETPNDAGFSEINTFLEKRNVGSLGQAFSEETLQRLLSMPPAAVLKAPPEKGPFPLVLYASGLNESWQHANNVLCEYLASHGHVVVALAQLGTNSNELTLRISPIDLETEIRDLEYALGFAQEFSHVDRFYDVAKHSIVPLLWGLAMELRDYNMATVALAPGFMRTERVMSHAKGETDWKKVPWLKRSESPEYVGRAVAALARDPHLMSKTGKAFHVGELAREYGFTDIDGRRVPPFIIREPFIEMVKRSQKSKP